MPYPFQVTQRTDGTLVTASLWNNDRQEVADAMRPDNVDDWSANVTQMSEITDPGGEGTENLAVDLAGEIKRIRHRLRVLGNKLHGSTLNKWYSSIRNAFMARSGQGGSLNPNDVGYVFTGDNDTGLFNPTDGQLDIFTNGVRRAYFDGTIFNLDIGRIRFPATQNASSWVNDLDDYEEGAWTPVYGRSGTSPSVTYSLQRGVYTKIGKLVVCSYLLDVSSVSNQGSGVLWVGGLPFLNERDREVAGYAEYENALSDGYKRASLVSPLDVNTSFLDFYHFFDPFALYTGNIAVGKSRGFFYYVAAS